MKPVTFYPGPSKVYPEVPGYVQDACDSGIVSINHRSTEFMELVAATKDRLKTNLKIPNGYELMFVSSATECWEILGQSFVREKSQHFFNGAFGEKWATCLEKLGKEVVMSRFEIDEPLPFWKINHSAEWVCITQNETSNGSAVNREQLQEIRKTMGDAQLLAVDATSSMGGIFLNFELGDFWFASVQKCFGLPAGMAVLIVSERAIELGREIGENKHYNSFLNVLKHTQLNQTHCTPNILDIYLLYRSQEGREIERVDQETHKRFNLWQEFIRSRKNIGWLVSERELRSVTVLTLQASPERLIPDARESGLILGAGYGSWKEDTIRIANFPAISDEEIQILMKFLSER